MIIAGTTFNTATPTTATLDDGNVVAVGPTGAVSVQEAQHQGPAKQSITVTPQDYVLGTWIPTFLAVLFSIPWHLLASAVKEIEPFYQLHSIDGVLAKDSIALDYRASISVVATFTAIKKRHYLVWWSGLMFHELCLELPGEEYSFVLELIGQLIAFCGAVVALH